MVKLFKDGDQMGIETDCQTGREFIQEYTLKIMQVSAYFSGDEEFQALGWGPMAYELALDIDGLMKNRNPADHPASIYFKIGCTDVGKLLLLGSLPQDERMHIMCSPSSELDFCERITKAKALLSKLFHGSWTDEQYAKVLTEVIELTTDALKTVQP